MFVALSSVLYLILAIVAIIGFDWSLNYSIDQQLQVLASGLGHAIELDGRTPHFRDWLRVVQTEPAHSLAAIQLYSPQGALIEHYGPAGPSRLIRDKKETEQFRLVVSPLTRNSQLLGYLQIALPTAFRDDSLQKLKITAALLAPVLLLGLGLTSYVVSDAATAPIRENLLLLKQFIADASHELNTPLSIVHARAEILEKKMRRSGFDLDDLQLISAASERMERIVNDLMLLAEIEGTLEHHREENIEVNNILNRIVAEFQPKFDDKGITLQLITGEKTTVRASEQSIQRIVSNLVENAWRYTERDGRVILRVTDEGGFAKIEVEDTGMGIPVESLPFIFDRFYRVDESRSRASGGSGLGLAIVKALVESHKGRVNVRSKPGSGSTFTVFLPPSS
jgi:signal transduction histidine kinase